jgi:hypothetical protein
LAALVSLAGSSIGSLVRKATRGFPADDVDELLGKLRLRPCGPLLRFMRQRLASFDDARLARRTAAGEGLVAHWRGHGVVVGGSALHRTHWLFAVRAREPARLRASLAAVGVDASGASNLPAVGGAAATALVDEMELLVDLMPQDTHVLLLDPERVRTRAHDLVAPSEEFLQASWAAAAGGETVAGGQRQDHAGGQLGGDERGVAGV